MCWLLVRRRQSCLILWEDFPLPLLLCHGEHEGTSLHITLLFSLLLPLLRSLLCQPLLLLDRKEHILRRFLISLSFSNNFFLNLYFLRFLRSIFIFSQILFLSSLKSFSFPLSFSLFFVHKTAGGGGEWGLHGEDCGRQQSRLTRCLCHV